MSDAVIKEEQSTVDGPIAASVADSVEAGQQDEAKPQVVEASANHREEEQEACVLLDNPPTKEADGQDQQDKQQQQQQDQARKEDSEGALRDEEGKSDKKGVTDIKETNEEDKTVKVEERTDEKEANVSIGAQEVSSTIKSGDERPQKSDQSIHRTSRRPSYNANRHHQYATGYQNYGLTYLPYKSNFEPSENARRRADEFFKTLKL